ncbi:MAG: ABC transporter substrate-binding protein [Bryobacteraceae bacterium]
MPRCLSFLLSLALFAGASFAAPPARIISTAPSITEILYALGLGDRVAAVTRFCRYPPEAQSKPKIGDYVNPNLEAMAALRPDLVVIQTNPVRLADRLNALRMKSLEVDQQNLQAIYKSIRDIAVATGSEKQAAALIGAMRTKLRAVGDRSAKLPRVKTMFVVGRAPGRLDGLIVVGSASYLNEMLALAGGTNIFSDAIASYPQVSLEEVLARNPDVIIDIGEMGDGPQVGDGGQVITARRQSIIALWQRANTVKAVKEHRVYPVGADIFVVPGPRAVNAAEEIFAMLHPAEGRGTK